MLCLLMLMFSSVLAFAGQQELPNIPAVSQNLEKKVEEVKKTKDFQRFKKLYEEKEKEAEALIKGSCSNRELQEKFDSIRNYYTSEAFRKQVEEAKKQIFGWRKDIGKYGRQAKKVTEGLGAEAKGYYLYVFLSKSLGRNFDIYLSDLDVLLEKQGNDIRILPYVVLRGLLVDQTGKPSFKVTVNWLRRYMEKHKVQVLIDPLLYHKYQVLQVPCLVLVSNDKECLESYIGCGYSVFGFLSEVEKRAKSENLKELLREIE